MIAHITEREVILAFGDPLEITVQGSQIEINRTLPYIGVEKGGIVVPRELTHALPKTGNEVFLLAGLEVHDRQTILVALIAVTLHGLPSNPLSVR